MTPISPILLYFLHSRCFFCHSFYNKCRKFALKFLGCIQWALFKKKWNNTLVAFNQHPKSLLFRFECIWADECVCPCRVTKCTHRKTHTHTKQWAVGLEVNVRQLSVDVFSSLNHVMHSTILCRGIFWSLLYRCWSTSHKSERSESRQG